jgi:hypothetical protein
MCCLVVGGGADCSERWVQAAEQQSISRELEELASWEHPKIAALKQLLVEHFSACGTPRSPIGTAAC